ncbi:MAG: hypothetical protein Q8P89_01375 [bacterium]|nr:hypothetical protein [bacterium]
MPLLTVQLPAKGKILVSVGQKITPGDPLLEEEDHKLANLNVARLLKTDPRKVKNILIKKVGEDVREGEVIAEKVSLFSKSRLKSPLSGILEKIDGESGILTFKKIGSGDVLKSHVAGKVVKIRQGEEIIIETEGAEIKAEQGWGGIKKGEIVILRQPHNQCFDLNQDLAGKIVGVSSWPVWFVSKAKTLGIAAILGQEIEEEAFGFGNDDFAILVFSSAGFEKVLKYNGCQGIVWGEGKNLFVHD